MLFSSTMEMLLSAKSQVIKYGEFAACEQVHPAFRLALVFVILISCAKLLGISSVTSTLVAGAVPRFVTTMV